MDEASLQAAVLQQPAHVLYPAVEQLSCGFAEAGWRTAIHASNEHLIPRPLTLSFCAPQPGAARAAELLDALLVCLRLHANVLASDRAVATVILHADIVQQLSTQLLEQLLAAIPKQLETVLQPLLEIRVAAGSPVPAFRLGQWGNTRLSVIDHAAADGPRTLRQARQAGFGTCCYQLCTAGLDDSRWPGRLQQVLALAPEQISLPPPGTSPVMAANRIAAWRLLRTAGYRAMGGDCYQRGDIAPPLADGQGNRHCDLAGVARPERCDFLGIGVGACSLIGDVICRIAPSWQHWRHCLEAGQPGVSAGLILSAREQLADEVVQSLACDRALDMRAFQWRNDLALESCFEQSMQRLQPYFTCGWLRRDGEVLRIENEGELVWRMIAACFRPLADELV